MFLLFFVLFLVGGWVFVYFLPRYIIQLRAKIKGLKITSREAYIIQKSMCTKDGFFEDVIGIWNLKKIPIENLTSHVLAGGSLVNLLDGFKELKQLNKEVSFSVLSAIDISGKNLRNEIKKADLVQVVKVENVRNAYLEINYIANYKYDFPNFVWMEREDMHVENLVIQKLEKFLKNWEDKDILKTELFIRENIITIDFWEREIRCNLISQEFKIRPITL